MMQSPKEAPPISWDDVQGLMQDLKQTARWLLGREGNAGSVHTTQLVNSALKKLVPKGRDWQEVTWEDREAFFKDAHFSRRRLLVDYARKRTRRQQVQMGAFETEHVAPLAKAGVFDLDRLVVDAAASAELAEAVATAIAELEQFYPRQQLAAIVQHRVFDGLGQEEIAKLLGITDRTVRTYQKLAYALLRKALAQYY
jgi:RNA polymerase sigma factor (sigma-70 family)